MTIERPNELRLGITKVILRIVKTAISIRDEIFEAAERLARSLGMSRSELYSTAVKEFVFRHSRQRITERLNEVYDGDDSASALDDNLQSLQIRSLPSEDWK